MKSKFLFLFVLFSQLTFACPGLDYYKKLALDENKFIVAFFYGTHCDNCEEFKDVAFSKPLFKNILNEFVYLPVSLEVWDPNRKMFLDYNTPLDNDIHALVLDANGKEITRISSHDNIYAIFQELQFYALPTNDLKSYLKQYNKKNSFENAEKLVEKYYEFSLKFNDSKRGKIVATTNSYLNEAVSIIKKKRKYNSQMQQKVALISLYELAFNKQFELLNEKLNYYAEAVVHEENLPNYYFLKLVVEKAFNATDYSATLLKFKNNPKQNVDSKLELINRLFT